MVMDNFPNGITSRGIPVVGTGGGAGAYGGGNIPATSGNYWFVSSVTGNNGNTGSFDRPFATLAFACTNTALAANDVIVAMPSHAETVTAAGGITLSAAGVRVVGLGNGDGRPKITFATYTTASWLISGANCSIDNIVGVAGLNSLANPFDITGNDCTITNLDWEDVASTYEAVHVIRATAVDDLTIQLRHKGLTGGSLSVSPIVLYGCSEAEIFIDYYGLSTVAAVQFGTGSGASKGVRVSGQAYVYGITDSSRLVVDTVNGSYWWAELFDGARGTFVAGGSGASFAVAGGGTAVANALYAASPSGVGTWPTAHAYGNGYSIASVLGYVQDAIRNGSGAALATNKSLVDALGTDGTTPASTTGGLFGAIGINNATNNFVSSAVTVNRTGSVFNRLADLIDQQEKCVATSAATMAQATDTIFTVAGGPIELVSLVGVFQTVNTGAASTFAIQANATAGGATAMSIASGSTSGAAAGTMLTLPAAAGSGTIVTTAGAQLNLFPAALWTIPVGTIQAIVGGAGTVGTVQWYLRYRPLGPGVTVTAGY
jgi:hypothetical protein